MTLHHPSRKWTALSQSSRPLVVDLDGTLLRSDLLLETGMAYLRSRPLHVFKPLLWLARGKTALKEGLATACDIDVSTLPYNETVIELIESVRRTGRSVVLATASHHSIATRIAKHLDLFDDVLASDAVINLNAHRKRDRLIGLYGEGGFDYAGNSRHDIPVWAACSRAYVVNPRSGVERQAKERGNVERVIRSRPVGIADWARALRMHQWIKNVLVFVPLLAAHQLGDITLLWRAVAGFLLFGVCASSVYLLNDLLDLGDDRRHPAKRQRPFAAGRLSISTGLVASLVLLCGALAGAWLLLPSQFAGALATYYLITLAYSLWLKRKMALDVIVLAMLYTLRIIAGALACGLVLTFWILAFSMFMFLSLALVKRFSELKQARSKGHTERTGGRGYYPDDLEMVSSLGAASGYLAVMILALYIRDHDTLALYAQPQIIWLACPLLLFWITRVWMLAHRGQMHDDPVIFAIRDPTSLLVGALFCIVFWLAA